MNLENTLPMIGFIVVMVGTPGPNNLMLMAAGANAGFRRSLPHILGIVVGCQMMLLAVAVGLGQVLVRFPALAVGLRVAGAAFLIWLAWQLVRRRHPDASNRASARPLTFRQAALFQWINPKAWMMIVTAIATYTHPGDYALSVAVVAGLFLLLSLPLISTWNLFGVALQGWLNQGRRLAFFNVAMAVLLLVSMYPTFIA
ncbi:lysine transporter LysE [Alcanivorax sp. N3-2A]|nr:lysine transporter LysE [Alcanivorax sp. N3-2A]|tara:strand:+ start:8259 stop:8858 length:600 start_codon:yes stop_codon:yes gene_type:complete